MALNLNLVMDRYNLCSSPEAFIISTALLRILDGARLNGCRSGFGLPPLKTETFTPNDLVTLEAEWRRLMN